MSVDAIKKARQIEKLAHSVKSKIAVILEQRPHDRRSNEKRHPTRWRFQFTFGSSFPT
jgi:CO dehydrogenase nickel-insertion accessory protein CooC1